MVQSSAAFLSLFSWPANTPEEHGNTHTLAFTQAQEHSRKYTYTHTHTYDATRLSVLYVRPTPIELLGICPLTLCNRFQGFTTIALYMLQQPDQPQSTAHIIGILKSVWFGVMETFAANVNNVFSFEFSMFSISGPAHLHRGLHVFQLIGLLFRLKLHDKHYA